MAGQSTYSVRPTADGIPGMLSRPEQECVLESKINAAAIPAGVFVCRDTSDDSAKVPAASGSVTATGFGFVKADVARQRNSDGTSTFAAKEGFTVMRRGRMFVLCETAAAYGGAVYVRITSDGASNTQLGKVRNDADISGSARAVALQGCRFVGTIAAAGLVEIELIPQSA